MNDSLKLVWAIMLITIFTMLVVSAARADAEGAANPTDFIQGRQADNQNGEAAAVCSVPEDDSVFLPDARTIVPGYVREYIARNNAAPVLDEQFIYVGAPGMRPLTAAEEEYLLRVLTQEVGADEALSWCVVQCLYNSCEYEEWRYTPYELLFEYGYTVPADFISETVRDAYDGIFMSGYVCEAVGDAMYFYAPAHCSSRWHESQRFIAEINGVRFFGRW